MLVRLYDLNQDEIRELEKNYMIKEYISKKY